MRPEVKEVAKQYVIKYTCATMADWMNQMKKEQEEANDWLFTKINELHITMEEFEKAIDECEKEAIENGSPCCYAADIFSTKFFRK